MLIHPDRPRAEDSWVGGRASAWAVMGAVSARLL